MSAPSTCTLSGTVYLAGAVASNSMVRIRISGPGTGITTSLAGTPTGDGQSIGKAVTSYTASGLWSAVLPYGVTFRIEIPDAGVDAVGAVPATSTADLSTLSLEDYVTWSRRNPGVPL